MGYFANMFLLLVFDNLHFPVARSFLSTAFVTFVTVWLSRRGGTYMGNAKMQRDTTNPNAKQGVSPAPNGSP